MKLRNPLMQGMAATAIVVAAGVRAQGTPVASDNGVPTIVPMRQQAVSGKFAVELQVWPDMVHQWQLFATLMPNARRALASDGAFIHKHMAAEGATQ
ncbi:hypothetical protein VSR82_36145 [Burkholderia sp. JPY481]